MQGLSSKEEFKTYLNLGVLCALAGGVEVRYGCSAQEAALAPSIFVPQA